MYSAPCLLADISINWNTQLKIILKISYFFNFWFIFFNGMTDVSPPFIHSAGWPIPSSYVHAWLLSHVWLLVTQWTVTSQVPLSMGILQARILEWFAIPSSRDSSQLKDQTQVSCISGGFFTIWATRAACSIFMPPPLIFTAF